MQKPLILLITLIIGCNTIAQVNLDSLWSVWNDKNQSDTNRLNALQKISWDGYLFSKPDSAYYFAGLQFDFAESINNKKQMSIALNTKGASFVVRGDYVKALGYYTRSLKIRERIGDENGVASSLSNIGSVYFEQGDLVKALDYNARSLKIKEKIGNKKSISISLNNIGNILFEQGDYYRALDYYTRSLKIVEILGDKTTIANILNNIGNIFLKQGETAKAMDYFTKCLKSRKEIGNKKGIASSLNNIGAVYKNLGEFTKAIDYYIKSLKINEEIGNKSGISNTLNNIGSVYLKQGDLAKALDYMARSLKIKEKIGDKSGISNSLNNIGSVYLKQGDLAKALECCTEALIIAQELGFLEKIKVASENLWEINKKLGKYQQALEMHELYIQIRDSVQSEENQRAAIHQQYKYDYEKQAASDSVVNAEANKVKNAQLAAEKAENKQHQLEADQQKQQKYFLYGILALALLFGGFIFNRFRITNKQKQLIESQKNHVEEKNKEILDSIQYAKRLQEAILPPKKIIKEYLSQSFILYKPKDIVAGDFYWMESLNGWTYFAAADCTGHGVPGAMVSVVCSNALSKSVIEEKIAEPAAILNRARELVIERFGRSEKQIKDGMDISLCAYHSVSGIVKWAGAHNPLWVIRKESKEIEVIKADSQPIGRYATNEPFTAHALQLNKGDAMYLFTDGFSDQFGGQKGKKYKTANFKRFLLSIQDKDMDTQHQLIVKEFDLWKGDLVQIDDVCVMGVRV